jgi:hypothetical protein
VTLLYAELGPLTERAPVCLLADEADPARLQLGRDSLEPLSRAREVSLAQIA